MPSHLTPVVPFETPIGAAAAQLCRRLSARAGEPVPYAFALAAARAADEFETPAKRRPAVPEPLPVALATR